MTRFFSGTRPGSFATGFASAAGAVSSISAAALSAQRLGERAREGPGRLALAGFVEVSAVARVAGPEHRHLPAADRVLLARAVGARRLERREVEDRLAGEARQQSFAELHAPRVGLVLPDRAAERALELRLQVGRARAERRRD